MPTITFDVTEGALSALRLGRMGDRDERGSALLWYRRLSSIDSLGANQLHSPAMAKHSSHVLELARKGAEHRYEELKAEIASLVRTFPHLTARSRSRRPTTIDVSSEPAAVIDQGRRKRRKMSAAARKKISLAQKRRWAKQKARKE